MVWLRRCWKMMEPDLETAETVHSVHSAGSYSDSDEEDLRAEQLLLKDKWRNIFDQFDPEGFGEIPWSEFLVVINQEEFKSQVPPEKIDSLIELAYKYSSTSSAITFQQFVNVMSGKRTQSFTCAVHWRDRQVRNDRDWHLMTREGTCLSSINSCVSREMLADPRDRKYYSDIYRCWPPPWVMLTVSTCQLALFCYHSGHVSWPQLGDTGKWSEVSLDSLLVFCPHRKRELWRFLSYCLVHSSWWHLTFNLLLQLVLGLPLEMVHGSARLGIIYAAGVLAGSLSTSVLDPGVCLVGASGGVYSLLAGHTANIVTNFSNTRYGGARLVATVAVASLEVGVAVYRRFDTEDSASAAPPLSYLAHISGSLAGVTIGLVILNNFQQKLWERWIWWTALFSYSAFVMATFVVNIIM